MKRNRIARKRSKMKGSDRVTDIVIVILCLLVTVCCIYPIWFTLVASVSDPGAIATGQVVFWPKGFNLNGYEKMFGTRKLWIGYRNSIIYTIVGILADLLVQLPCGYALSRARLPFRKGINLFFIITMYFSGGMIPSYMLNVKLGFVDNPLVLIIPCCVSVYNMILIKNFLQGNIPESLFESARLDGASYTQFFGKVVVPLAVPIIAIISLFSMQSHWNTYLNAQMYLYSSKYHTLQQVIVQITATMDTSLAGEGTMMDASVVAAQVLEKQLMKYAVVVVSALPMLLVYPFIQKFLIKGITMGAVKG